MQTLNEHTSTEKTNRRKKVVRIGAMADIHCTKSSEGQFQSMFAQVGNEIDILLLAGDLTDYGLPDEAHVLLHELTAIKVPIVAVLGNHDFESGKAEEVIQVLMTGGIKMLDGDACEVLGLGIAGTKGFAGGFGRGTLGPWGEAIVKEFVGEAVSETLKFEAALSRLRTPVRIGLLHYAPIEETVEGEPREIYPFLGCGRLAEPLTRYPVTAVFHGHAHRGSPQGKIGDTVSVYNVALPLLRRLWPDMPPVRVVNVEVSPADEEINRR